MIFGLLMLALCYFMGAGLTVAAMAMGLTSPLIACGCGVVATVIIGAAVAKGAGEP